MRIEIVRTGDPRKVGVEALFVCGPYHLLDDDRHLLLFQPVGSHPDIVLRALVERRGVDLLDRVQQVIQPHKRIEMPVREHVRLVDSRKGMVLRVLQQAGGSYRQRGPHEIEKRGKLPQNLFGKTGGLDEPAGDLPVVGACQCEFPESVLVDELVEDIRPQDRGGGDVDDHVLEAVADVVVVDERADESQAPGLPSERAPADPGEAAVGVERLLREIGDDPALPYVSVVMERLDKVGPEGLRGRVIRDLAGPKLVRQPEFSPRLQPVGEVVPFGVVEDALLGDERELLFQAAQVGGAPHFDSFACTEGKVAEAERVSHELPQVVQHHRRVLHDERRPGAARILFVCLDVGHEKDGDVRLQFLHGAGEIDPRARVLFAQPGEIDVGDNAESELPVLLEIGPGLLVR